MNWIECKLSVAPMHIDNLVAVLSDYIPSGFVVEDDAEMHNFLDENPFNWDYIDDELRNKPINKFGSLTFYLPVDAMEMLITIEDIIKETKVEYELTTDVKDDVEWLEKWKEFYKTFQIGCRVEIGVFAVAVAVFTALDEGHTDIAELYDLIVHTLYVKGDVV
jgi:ribosomal protein L11 methylase PrmA